MAKKTELFESGELASWPPAEKAFLERFYKEHKAKTWEEKYVALEKHLGGENHFYSRGGVEVTLEQKVGCLEYEILINNGLAVDCLR